MRCDVIFSEWSFQGCGKPKFVIEYPVNHRTHMWELGRQKLDRETYAMIRKHWPLWVTDAFPFRVKIGRNHQLVDWVESGSKCEIYEWNMTNLYRPINYQTRQQFAKTTSNFLLRFNSCCRLWNNNASSLTRFARHSPPIYICFVHRLKPDQTDVYASSIISLIIRIFANGNSLFISLLGLERDYCDDYPINTLVLKSGRGATKYDTIRSPADLSWHSHHPWKAAVWLSSLGM